MSDRKLAGPFVPVEGVEWCTIHHGVVDECSDAPQGPCEMADEHDDETDCNIVTLYIEVQS